LHLVQRLDARHNPALARMMTDYAFERWAASRVVPWELWRCVGPHPDARCLEALERAIKQHADPQTSRSAALAAAGSTVTAATALVVHASDETRAAIADGRLNWTTLVAEART
jgi:hypothetical protein